MSYSYLNNEKSPQLFVQAYKLIGVKEIPGKKHNPVIIRWADKLGMKKIFPCDEVAWCGLFIAYVCYMADLDIVKDPLWARNWSKWGTKQDVAMFGDLLVFKRGKGGHVGIYVGEDAECYHVLGGNQSNCVNITRIDKSRCIAIRRTPWNVAQPKNVRVINLLPEGEISINEA